MPAKVLNDAGPPIKRPTTEPAEYAESKHSYGNGKFGRGKGVPKETKCELELPLNRNLVLS